MWMNTKQSSQTLSARSCHFNDYATWYPISIYYVALYVNPNTLY